MNDCFLEGPFCVTGGQVDENASVSKCSKLPTDADHAEKNLYFGEMGLQTRYSMFLQQPRVKGLTPP